MIVFKKLRNHDLLLYQILKKDVFQQISDVFRVRKVHKIFHKYSNEILNTVMK